MSVIHMMSLPAAMTAPGCGLRTHVRMRCVHAYLRSYCVALFPMFLVNGL
jgi:hypothetical protein